VHIIPAAVVATEVAGFITPVTVFIPLEIENVPDDVKAPTTVNPEPWFGVHVPLADTIVNRNSVVLEANTSNRAPAGITIVPDVAPSTTRLAEAVTLHACTGITRFTPPTCAAVQAVKLVVVTGVELLILTVAPAAPNMSVAVAEVTETRRDTC
jgi:hypothetical protein